MLEGRENVILRFRNGADHPHLMLHGHMDTVGAGVWLASAEVAQARKTNKKLRMRYFFKMSTTVAAFEIAKFRAACDNRAD